MSKYGSFVINSIQNKFENEKEVIFLIRLSLTILKHLKQNKAAEIFLNIEQISRTPADIMINYTKGTKKC